VRHSLSAPIWLKPSTMGFAPSPSGLSAPPEQAASSVAIMAAPASASSDLRIFILIPRTIS
jgi:hypothetical protein